MDTRPALPDLDTLNREGLKALIFSQQERLRTQEEQLLSREQEIEHLKLLLAQLRRIQFGRKSEKLARQIEQLELKLEHLECQRSAAVPAGESESAIAESAIAREFSCERLLDRQISQCGSVRPRGQRFPRQDWIPLRPG